MSTAEDALANDEVMKMVDQEIGRLPEKLQAAVVLCLIQGRTHDAVARELGWPIGTVKSRLASARATLTSRLRRRGVAPSWLAGLNQAGEPVAAVAVPHDLARGAIESALQATAGPSVHGAVLSASVESLSRRVLWTMSLSRLKMAVGGLAVLGALVWAVPPLLVAKQGGGAHGRESIPSVTIGARPSAQQSSIVTATPSRAAPALRLGTVKYRQDSPIYRIFYSPDGKYVVTEGDDGRVRVWDSISGRLVRRLDAELGAVHAVAFSPDGKSIVEADTGLDFRKQPLVLHVSSTDLGTGRLGFERSWELPGPFLWSLGLSCDTRLVAAGSGQGLLTIINAATRDEFSRFTLPGQSIHHITFSPAGNCVAVVSNSNGDPQETPQENQVRVFDLDLKKELWMVPIPDYEAERPVFSSDGSVVGFIVGQVVQYRDAATGRRVPTPIYDGKSLAFALKANSFYLWEPKTKLLLDSPQFRGVDASVAAFSPDGRTIASNGGPTVIHFWDIASQRDRLVKADAPLEQVDCVLVTPDGKTLITGSSDKMVRLWDLTTGLERKVLPHEGEVKTMSLSRDGRLLMTGTQCRCWVYLWDLAGAEKPPMIADQDNSAPTLRFPVALRYAPEDGSATACWSDGQVKRWDGKLGRLVDLPQPQFSAPRFPAPSKDWKLTGGCFSSDGRKLAAITFLGGLGVADLATGKELYGVPDAQTVLVSPDDLTLAVTKTGGDLVVKRVDGMKLTQATANSSILLLDTSTGKEKVRMEVPGSPVWALAFSPGGKTLAATTGWEQGQIHLYETATGKETRLLNTPPIRTSALTFTPDGSRVITGMADTSVLVWDLRLIGE